MSRTETKKRAAQRRRGTLRADSRAQSRRVQRHAIRHLLTSRLRQHVVRRACRSGRTCERGHCDGHCAMSHACRAERRSAPAGGRMRDGEERLGLLAAALCALSGAFVPALAKLTTGRADALFVAAASNLCAAGAALPLLAWRGELRWSSRGRAPAASVRHRRARHRRRASAVLPRCQPNQCDCRHALPADRARVRAGPGVASARTSADAAPACRDLVAAGRHRVRHRRSAPSGVGGRVAAAGDAALLAAFASHRAAPAGGRRAARAHRRALCVRRCGAGAGLAGDRRRATLPASSALASLLPLLAVQGCVLGYVGTLFWYQAITRLDLARTTAIVVPAIPLLSFAASFLLLGEVASPRQWLGLLLTAAGILDLRYRAACGPRRVRSPRASSSRS